MIERIGQRTMLLKSKPVITGCAGVAGKKEGQGPLKSEFDYIFDDTTLGQNTWEKAESAMLHDCIIRALSKAGKSPSNMDFVLAGDLLDQCTGSNFALKDLDMPFIGLYGACSTMALTLCNAAMLTEAGASRACVAATSSHFCSSEKQFRFPLEYGGVRPPTSQWTVTGAGAAVVEPTGAGVRIEKVHIGRIVDLGIQDANNMGAAMAPAARQTISEFLEDTGTAPEDYDMILTGDLGQVGTDLLHQLLLKEDNLDISAVHHDCGLIIFDLQEQDVHAGGSGCGCSASVLCAHIIPQMLVGNLKKVLFVATGALMSPTSAKQGQTIPGIAHAVMLTTEQA